MRFGGSATLAVKAHAKGQDRDLVLLEERFVCEEAVRQRSQIPKIKSR